MTTEDTGFGSVHEISVEVDGSVHTGRFSESPTGISVHYGGRELQAPIGHDRPEETAQELLRQLVREGAG